MPLWTQNKMKWEKPEWFSFLATFCILILYPIINGFPFIGNDTWRYASGRIAGTTNVASPVLGCAMWPVLEIGGLWGFVVVQTAAAAFALVFLSNVVFKRHYVYTFYFSILAAGIGMFSGLLMSDIWSLIGLICLFSISIGYRYFLIAALLAFSYSVHYGNFPIYTATAALFLPFANYKVKYIVTVFFCILSGAVIIISANFLGGEIRFGPRTGQFVFPAARILHDIPEVIDRKCQDDPAFKLCEIKAEIHKWSQGPDYQVLTWKGTKLLNIDVASKEFNDLAREVVFYSIKHFFVENILAVIRNTYGLVSAYRISSGFSPFGIDSWPVEGLKKYYPDDLDEYESTWQAKSIIYRILKMSEKPLTIIFILSAIACMVYIGLNWKARHEDEIFKLSVFGVTAVLVNAFITSNISGVYGRFQARIGFILIFPGLIILTKLTDSLIKRTMAHQKNGKISTG